MIQGIQIPRLKLLSVSLRRIKNGHCLIIGEPGVGKSHLIQKLVRRFREKGERTYFLSADEFSLRKKEDLEAALGIRCPIVEVLNVLSSGNASVLFVDALDAARDESTQRTLREIIRDIEQRCSDWTIVAAVRTYDALQSREVRLLFPPRVEGDNEFARSDVSQNHLLVTPLTDEELHEAGESSHELRVILEKASPEFKQLLCIPRNLEFTVKLVKDGVDLARLSSIQSEVQLVSEIWDYYVLKGNQKESKRKVVKEICTEMFDKKRLTVDRTRIVDRARIDISVPLEELLHDSIIEPAGKQSDLVRFSNHTFFDYALSRHVIAEDSPGRLIKFLEAKENSVFFRPSIRYFYSSLWFFDRPRFWTTLMLVTLEKDLAPAEQAMPFVTLTEEARGKEDIQELLGSYKEKKPASEKAIKYTLISLNHYLRSNRQGSYWWIVFLHDLVDSIDTHNWRFLIDCICWFAQKDELETIRKSNQEFHLFAGANRDLLRRGWETNDERISGMNSRWIVDNVCLTFDENTGESRALLSNILDRLGKSCVAIDEFYSLCEAVPTIARYDPEFVVRIYEKGFLHQETLDETRKTGGYVLTLLTNRKQDFHMAQYLLERAFSGFAKSNPVCAAEAAVKAIEGHYQNNERASEDYPTLNEGRIRLRIDLSCIWDGDQTHGDYAHQILRQFEEWLAATDDKSNIQVVCEMLVEINELAAVWRRVLVAIERNPENLSVIATELLTNKPILVAQDTHYQAAKALGAVFPHLMATSRMIIEQAIAELPHYDAAWQYKPEALAQVLETLQAELLYEIPFQLLQSADLRELHKAFKENGKLKEAPRPFGDGSFEVGPYTARDWLADQGVDLNDARNATLFKATERLNSKMETLRKSKAQAILVEAQEEVRSLWDLYNQEKDLCDEHVREATLTALSEFADVTLGCREFEVDSEFGKLLQDIAISAAKDKSPQFDPKYHSDFRLPSWSPSPRTEGAQALMKIVIVHQRRSETINKLLVQLSSDRVPAVRFHIVRNLDWVYKVAENAFWEIVYNVASKETTLGVLQAFLHGIDSLTRNDQTRHRIVEVIRRILARIYAEKLDAELANDCYRILTDIFIRSADDSAEEEIRSIFHRDLASSRFVFEVVRNSLPYLLIPISHLFAAWQNRKEIQARAMSLVYDCLTYVENQSKGLEEQDYTRRPQEIRELLHVIEGVIEHFYFDVDFGTKHQRDSATPLTNEERKAYFDEIAIPILSQTMDVCDPSKGGALPAGAAHNFLELSLALLPLNFKAVLGLVNRAFIVSKPAGYLYDNFSMKDLKVFVDLSLADHRAILREDVDALRMLSEILDLFVEVGWHEAVSLVLRLDLVFQ
jgi:hypothetical protein